MSKRLTRRQVIVGAAALAACDKTTGPSVEPQAASAGALASSEPAAPGHLGETRLYVPSTSGSAAGFQFAQSPAWELDAPGWYVPQTSSAGAGMLMWSTPPRHRIAARLKSFVELPALLDQAKALGTSVLYLVDWYQGTAGTPLENWWGSRGDYVPRLDLGGEAALKAGIAAVHAQGGRVVLYVEGFIITKNTNVGKQHGADWSIELPDGPPAQPYPFSWKLCPAAEGWVAYMEALARRLGSYGVDGMMLDSYGYQKDWMCVARAHGHALGDKEVFNNGAAQLVRRVRAALRAVVPEGVVFTELPALERLFAYADGSLDWGVHAFVARWNWDAQGRTDTILTGYSLDDWNQVLAIGAKLACPTDFLERPPESSATAHTDAAKQRSWDNVANLAMDRVACKIFAGVHHWRNAGLLLGLDMPGLDDLTPRTWPRGTNGPESPGSGEVMALLRQRAAAIDAAFAGKQAPAPAEHVKALLAARASLAPIIDYGSTVTRLDSGSPRVAAWRFTSPRGTALTCANVADKLHSVAFPGATGTWKDAVTGESFAAAGSALTVPTAAHRVRLLRNEAG